MLDKRFVLLFVAAALIGMAREAQAEDQPYSFGNDTEAFLLGGLSGGGSFGSAGGGGYIGAELSMAWLKEMLWGGLYVDGAYDFGHEAATISAGPEFGYGVFGLDGGIAARLGYADDPEWGAHARGLITAGVFSLYGRWGFFPGTDAEHIVQVGVLLKLPLWGSIDLEEVAR